MGHTITSCFTDAPPTVDPLCAEDPTGTFLKVRENNCREFVLCIKGTAGIVQCPAGLEFSSALLKCVLPEMAQCGKSEPSTTTSTTTTSTTTTVVPTTQAPSTASPVSDIDVTLACQENPTGVFFVAVPSDCTKYVFCVVGQFSEMVCENGRYFSSEKGACVDSMEEAGCSS